MTKSFYIHISFLYHISQYQLGCMKNMEYKRRLAGAITGALIIFMCLLLIVPANAQSNAEVDYLDIDVKINDGYAITTVEEKLDNVNNFTIADKFEFLIPEKAFLSGFSISIDGEEYQADILKKAEAQQKFEEATSGGRTAGLVETRDSELFSYSLNFEANQSIVVKLTYEQVLTRTLDEYEYLQYLRSDHDVNDLQVSIDIDSSTDVLSVGTPGFRSDITYPDTNSARVGYTDVGLPGQDLKVVFKTENTPLNGNMLFYESNGQGYFMHTFSPTEEEVGISPLNKDIIFVIDKSGSMSGLKIQQVQTAFSQIINDLPEGDRFNVVFFDSSVRTPGNELLMANDANKVQSVEMVTDTTAQGGTNINDALLASLDLFNAGSDNVPIIVFLTDGMPTDGIQSTAVIRQNVMDANLMNASIFSIAFGSEYDYDFNFLQALSLENGGIAVYFEPDTEASSGISNFYDTISTPLVSDLTFSYDEQVSNTVLTGKKHLFVGSEVMLLGKYDQDAETIIARVDGNTRSGKHVFEREFIVQPEEKNNFVARLWAYNNIMNKLDRMKVEGETDELVSEVTNLSLEYGFVTPYTSFFVEVPQAEEPDEEPVDSAVDEAVAEEAMVDEISSDEEVVDSAMEEPETPGFSFLLAASAIGGTLLFLRRMDS